MKKPLHADRSTASTRLTMADKGSFPKPVARTSGMGFTGPEVYGCSADEGERVLAVETHAGPSFEELQFEELHLAADEAGVVDESIAHGAALPSALEHGGVPVQDLIAHPAVFRLDAQ